MSGAVLLTGATGFLGMDALARLLARDGFRFRCNGILEIQDHHIAWQRFRLLDSLRVRSREIKRTTVRLIGRQSSLLFS